MGYGNSFLSRAGRFFSLAAKTRPALLAPPCPHEAWRKALAISYGTARPGREPWRSYMLPRGAQRHSDPVIANLVKQSHEMALLRSHRDAKMTIRVYRRIQRIPHMRVTSPVPHAAAPAYLVLKPPTILTKLVLRRFHVIHDSGLLEDDQNPQETAFRQRVENL